MEDYIQITKSALNHKINYFGYYQNLLVYQNKNLDIMSFNKLIHLEKENQPQMFHIKHEKVYEKKLQEELNIFMSLFEHHKVKASIFESLKEKYGTIGQVFYTKSIEKLKLKEKENKSFIKYSEWIDNNTKLGFLSRFPFSSLLPYIFLDVDEDDSILSCGLNNPSVCGIISEKLKDGYFFINEKDEIKAKSEYNFGFPNICVISYSNFKIPFIQEFDKVLCIAPSTNEEKSDEKSLFSLNKAVENHQKQKENLISALEKVKVGGICIYSTYSIDPFENEAVVNSVLQMDKYKDKFEIVDCSNKYEDIERKEGLTSWDVNKDLFDIQDDELIESLSSKNIVNNMKYCMRFYPHQIHSGFTFISVIKKIDQFERIYTHDISQSTKVKNYCQFSKADKSMIQNIKNIFGFDDEIDDIPFVFFKSLDKKLIIHINQNLMNVLNENFLESLKIKHLGALAFIVNEKYPQSQYIPSVQTLPKILKKPNKQYIIINFNDFKKMAETNCIPLEYLSNKNENDFESIRKGGVYLLIKECGTSIGGIVNDFCIEYYGKNKSIQKHISVIKENYTPKIGKKYLKDISGEDDYDDKITDHEYSEFAENNKKSSEFSDSINFFELAIRYERGEGLEQDYSKAIEYYQKAADLNNSSALYNLGICYKEGKGVEQDYSKAIEYFQKSADLNNSSALYNLGLCYEEGEGVEQDYSKAIEYYQKAADLNNSSALYNLGLCYEEGEGVEQDYSKAIEYYQKSADLNNSSALNNLGICYKEGEGVEQDYSKAIEYYQKSADLNNSSALNNLGICYKEGKGVEQDYSKAIEYYQKSADLNNSYALNNLGICYKEGKGVEQDYSKAIEYYQKAADLNNSSALNNLGICYKEGKGVEQDYSKAIEYYQKAADLNNSYALNNLGICYKEGKGVEQDYSKAIEYYQKSADLNNSYALYNLGLCYEEGKGVEQDYSKAIEYYQKSADLNNSSALNNLGICYKEGKGVEQDYSKAIEYYQKAADLNNSYALNNLGICYKEGKGVEQDYSKAIEYYQKSADLNNSYALNNLGICYKEGKGVEQDYSKAIEYYQKSADLNNSYALYNLGLCYKEGKGVEQDYSKAIEYFQKSADLNNSYALYNLGLCYEEGEGVEQDYSKAIEYYQKSADLNSSYALNNLKRCNNK